MTNYIIKPTAKADIPALKIVLDQTELFPSEMLEDMLTPSLIDASTAFWLSCHLDQNVVGFCHVVQEELTDGTWNMLALAVRPDCQGKGFGAALVTAAERRLASQNQRILIIETSGTAQYALTRKFYTQNGYEEEARIRDFWSKGDDKVVFRKAL